MKADTTISGSFSRDSYSGSSAEGKICITRKRRRQLHVCNCSWLLAMTVLPGYLLGTSAFQLRMVASHGRTAVRPRTAAPSAPSPRPFSLPSPSGGSGGVTSSLISQLAVVALKLRLADQAAVKCDVTASSSDLLLRGHVGPVTVRGRSWASQLGLTCRAIDATVHKCYLDMGSIVSRQKLVLTTPAKGDAMIALDSEDFANFINHPLMKPPTLPSGESFRFLKDGVSIDPGNGGYVTFYGEYMEERWECTLRRGGRNGSKAAIVSVTPVSTDKMDENLANMSAQLTEIVSEFFNFMVFELDGTFLSFQDMMVTTKGDSTSVMLALAITVKKFPSKGLAF